MSLTSYRAAPSRASVAHLVLVRCIVREIRLLCCKQALFIRFGSDLLSHVLRRSTISAAALNCRVRDGIGCFARAMTTKPKKQRQSQNDPVLALGEQSAFAKQMRSSLSCCEAPLPNVVG